MSHLPPLATIEGVEQTYCTGCNEPMLPGEPHTWAECVASLRGQVKNHAFRAALLCRERWATDGFGRPTAAFVEACGVVAATWVEQGRDALPVSELLSCVRGLVALA